MRRFINIVENAGTPEWFSNAPETHPDDPDTGSGDAEFILEPEEYSDTWRSADVPMEVIDARDGVPGQNPEETEARLNRVRNAPELNRAILELHPNGRASIMDGWHRYRVAKERGQTHLPAIIRMAPRS